MYDLMEELLQHVALGEDSTLELKEVFFRGESSKVSDPKSDDVADEIAAFANSRLGGVLVLGVQNRTRQVVGIPKDRLDVVERWLRDILDNKIKPRQHPAPSIRHVPVTADSSEAVLVRVDIPPSLIVHCSPGGYFERVGSAASPIPPDALARLMQHRSQVGLIRFEEQAVSAATFADLDSQLCQRFVVPGEGTVEAQLRRLHLVDEKDGEVRPTVAGILVGSRQPNQWLRGAWIQAVAYAGVHNDPADQVDAKNYTGPVDQQIFDAQKFVERNSKTGAKKTTVRTDVPQFSKRAVFEALVNAVAHRDYSITEMPVRVFVFSDRLEITSPGALPNTMTIESMRAISMPRNELLCSLFARYFPIRRGLGRSTLMDRRGAGVDLIYRETQALAGSLPSYQQVDRLALRLTIPAARPHNDKA